MRATVTTWIRRIIRTILYAILLIVACAALAFAFVQTGPGRRVVANAVTQLLAELPYLQADIQGVSGLLPFHVRIETLTLRDEEGLWLEADGASAHLSVRDLFRGKVLLPDVSADQLHIVRAPHVGTNEAADESEEPKGKLEMPPILFSSIAIDRLVLDPALTGISIYCSLTGHGAIWDEPGVISAHAEVTGLLEGDGPVDVRIDVGADDTAIEAKVNLTQLAWDDLLVGEVDGSLTLTLPDSSVEIRFDGSGRWEDIPVKASADCAYTTPALAVRTLEIHTPFGEATAHGEFDLPSRRIVGSIDASVPDLATFSPAVGLDVRGQVSGRFEATERDGGQALRGGIHGAQTHGPWGMIETFDASLDIADVSAFRDMTFAFHGKGFERDALRIQDVDLRGSVSWWDRTGSNALHDAYAALVATGLGYREAEAHDVQIAGQFDQISLKEFASSSGVTVTGTANAVTHGDIRVEVLHATAETDEAGLRIAADAEGWIHTNVAMRLQAAVAQDDRGWRSEVSSLQAEYGEHAARLENAAFGGLSADGFYVTNVTVSIDDALLEAAGQWQSNRFDIVVRTQDLNTHAIPIAALANTAGALSAELSLSGTLENPVGKLHGELNGFRSTGGGLQHLPDVNLKWDASMREGELSASLDGATEDGGRLQASAVLPAHVTLVPPGVSWMTNQLMVATVTSALDLATFNRLPLLSEQRLGGQFSADLRYEGTASDGNATGYCRIQDGTYENFTFGTILREIELDLVGNDDELELRSASASDGRAGHIRASGSLDLTPEDGFALDVETTMQKVRLARLDALTATTSGSLSLTGSVTRLHVDGNITVDEALLDLNLLPPPPPPALDDFDRSVDTETNAVEETTSTAWSTAALTGRINISIPPEFSVRGPGLNSLWEGEFLFALEETGMRLTGRVEPRRGTYDFLGRRFDLRDGEIDVGGAWPPVPVLNLRAVHRRPEITAILHIRGRATDPRFELTSDPPYPADEVLSRVLFGQGAGTITGLQALELAAAVNSMHSGRSGGGILERTKDALSVDHLGMVEQGEAGAGQATLVVGKHISDRVYVEVNQGFDRGGTIVTVEYEIRRNLTIETDTGNARLNPGIGVNWKRDY